MSSMDPWRPDPNAVYDPSKPKKKSKVPSFVPKLRDWVIFVPWAEDSPESKEWKSKSEQWNVIKNNKYKIVYWNPVETDNAVLARASALPDASIYIRGHGSPGAPSIVTKVKDLDIPLAIEDACDRLIGMGLKTSFKGAIKFHFCYSGTVFPEKLFVEKEAKALKGVNLTKSVLADQAKLHTEAKDEVTRLENKNVVKKLFLGKEIGKAQKDKSDAKQQLVAGAEFLKKQELKVPTRESLAAKGARHMRALGFTNCRYYGYLGPVESEYGSLDTDPTGPDDYHKFVNVEALHDIPEGLAAKITNPKAVRASVARVRIP